MIEYGSHELGTVFHALGDATRRQMLQALTEGERTVSELASPFDISLAAASKHIKVLEHAGLIRREVRGRTHTCRLDPGPLAAAHDWLAFYQRFWTSRLDALEELLRVESGKADQRKAVTQKKPVTRKPANQKPVAPAKGARKPRKGATR